MSRAVAVVVVCLAAAGGCGRRPDAGLPERFVEFVDRAADLGITVPFSSGAEAEQNTILESLGGGAGWIDVDRDGRPDLVAPGGGGFDTTVDPPRITGRPLAIWRNVPGGPFREVAAAAGLDDDTLSSHGVAVGDYDADGFPDLFVTGYGIPQLWHNRGDGTFAAVGPPGGRDDRWSTSAGWSASRPLMPGCARSAWPSTSAPSRRCCAATWPSRAPSGRRPPEACRVTARGPAPSARQWQAHRGPQAAA